MKLRGEILKTELRWFIFKQQHNGSHVSSFIQRKKRIAWAIQLRRPHKPIIQYLVSFFLNFNIPTNSFFEKKIYGSRNYTL